MSYISGSKLNQKSRQRKEDQRIIEDKRGRERKGRKKKTKKEDKQVFLKYFLSWRYCLKKSKVKLLNFAWIKII